MIFKVIKCLSNYINSKISILFFLFKGSISSSDEDLPSGIKETVSSVILDLVSKKNTSQKKSKMSNRKNITIKHRFGRSSTMMVADSGADL
jgi:hypothetical protein